MEAEEGNGQRAQRHASHRDYYVLKIKMPAKAGIASKVKFAPLPR
jgi:hypothetical protein